MERHFWQKDKYINVDQNVNIRIRPSLLGSRLQINQCCKYNINICHELGGIYKLWTPNYSRYDQRQKYMLWARVVNPAAFFCCACLMNDNFPPLFPPSFPCLLWGHGRQQWLFVFFFSDARSAVIHRWISLWIIGKPSFSRRARKND